MWENSYRAVRHDELGLHQQRRGQHATPYILKNRSRRGRGMESEGSRDELQAEASMLHWRVEMLWPATRHSSRGGGVGQNRVLTCVAEAPVVREGRQRR